MLDMGFQNYMSFEFLKLGRTNVLALSKSLWSGMVFGVAISLFQIVLIGVFAMTGIIVLLMGEAGTDDFDLFHQARIALLLQGITWLFLMTIPGLVIKALNAFGHFPITAWWGVLFAIVSAVGPLISVISGGDLLEASIALTAACFIYAVGLYTQLFVLLRRERVRILKPSFSLGYANFLLAMPLLGKSLLENVRQQGVRLLIAPLAGPVGLAAFSTMRTGANVALQGLNTIIHPLLPDLMRFLHDRDQGRSEAGFATVWIVVVMFIAPGVVVLQTVVEPLYVFWTQGKIHFDPTLFALLSLGVLVYAVFQPAMAVVIGNNLTKIQLALAAISAVIVFGFIGILVPEIGIIGAGIALLLAEIAAAVGYWMYARRWLDQNEMKWPGHSFNLALVSVFIAAAALALIIIIPHHKWLILAASMLLFNWNIWRYWRSLPKVAAAGFNQFLVKVPFLKRRIK